MNTTTRAQRINARQDKIWDTYQKQLKDKNPTPVHSVEPTRISGTRRASSTEGPWRLERMFAGANQGKFAVMGGFKDYIAQVDAVEGEDKNLANARLIAAAPDLLELVRWSCCWATGWKPTKAEREIHYAKCRAAIAKATIHHYGVGPTSTSK